MANQSDTVLTTSADQIMNETIANANTASRVGAMFNALIDSKINNDKIDTDGTLAANSDSLVASQKAIKTYVNSGKVYEVKVSLTTAEILQLFTTPKVLVAAQGAGTIIMPLRFLVNATFNTVAYTTNTGLIVGLGTIFSTTLATALAFSASQLATYTLTTAASSATAANSINKDITLSVGVGNPAAGNSPIDVYLTYMIITV